MRGRGSGRKFFAVWLCHLPSCRLRRSQYLSGAVVNCENRTFPLEACSWFLARRLSVPYVFTYPKLSGVRAGTDLVLELQSEGSRFSPSLSTEPALCVSLQL